MWRLMACAGAILLLGLAGILSWKSMASVDDALPAPPPSSSGAMLLSSKAPSTPPAASDRTREDKRFDRYDKDQDQSVTREEYLASRRKAWARLDTDHDGKLSFEEWATKATSKFAAADADRSGRLSRTEFASTRVKRRAMTRCACPPAKDEE